MKMAEKYFVHIQSTFNHGLQKIEKEIKCCQDSIYRSFLTRSYNNRMLLYMRYMNGGG